MTAKCDVLLPVYNGAATVRQAVASLLAQTMSDLRVIIIDDGSAQPCAELLGQIAASDSRVLLIRQANRGIVTALNHGLARSTATVVARLDADDLAAPDRLERQFACFEAHPDIVATSGMVRHIDAAGVVVGTYQPPDPDRADPDWTPSIEPYLIHPFLAVRRQAIEAIGGYRHVHHAEDTDLYWRLREIGRLFNLPQVLGDYRLHDDSISGSSVINGRIMAIHSQLAAISSKRRRAGLPDLTFERAQLADYRNAGSIDMMMSIAESRLTPDEQSWFRVAVGAKLLELASYRPWKLEERDLRFIRAVWRESRGEIAPHLRRELANLMQRIAATMVMERGLDAVTLLAEPVMYPGILARTAKRLLTGQS